MTLSEIRIFMGARHVREIAERLQLQVNTVYKWKTTGVPYSWQVIFAKASNGELKISEDLINKKEESPVVTATGLDVCA
ncbi:hypothetical protein NI470_05965 [Acinetobacter lwoffii]|uniref:hypothetical protein n=1 Tax=Acinetobacter lwoffii TaxID=28090 RepID=UPI00209B74E4|nr:hypothetical protein [Acinetobacter lwoffii]MCO8073034.1 hypothetical protein [Acinetobacter lwoffii]MCO8076152.1 hypothetical protein [Acinetobacter lwoffii]